ncbi:hypothetical protein MMC25_006923 [Agyrium rufum]|nr:hypothetical protein [Agyrium rufum]
MKYGETLHQRSIPEWGTYNIDYNEIKHLIKIRTTSFKKNGKSKAISIPGTGGVEVDTALEQELYMELSSQHERMDLFVQSKAGEITRKLSHLHRQILQLGRLQRNAKMQRMPVRRLERYSRIESEVLKTGDEIQSLSRFVAAQRLGFHKLLKKYKKWTGSSALGEKFCNEVLNRDSSFTNRDFTPLLSEFTDILTEVRAPFEAGFSWKEDVPAVSDVQVPTSPQAKGRAQEPITKGATSTHEANESSAKELHLVTKEGSDVDLDTSLATIPLGSHAGRATYWVHSDNLVQIHVLLLQHTRLRRHHNRDGSQQASSRPSRKVSTSTINGSSDPLSHDEITTVVCDDLQEFAKRRGVVTIAELEAATGSTAEEATASIRYSPTGEAVVIVGTSTLRKQYSQSSVGQEGSMQKIKLKRKSVSQLFARQNEPELSRTTSTTSFSSFVNGGSSVQEIEKVRTWLLDHHNVQPLVHLTSRRARFIGLQNNEKNGIWVTLDTQVSMKRSSLEDLDAMSRTKDASSSVNSQSPEPFKHAVLEVRWEGKAGQRFAQILDESHLATRIRGFSLETHAIATLCKPTGMPTPFWFPTLNGDIRKLPPKKPQVSRRQSTQLTPESSSTHPTSTSATSVTDGATSSGFSAGSGLESPATSVPDQLEKPPLKAFKKKRRSTHRRESPLRYWNEYEDGDEARPDEPYTIIVDPNGSSDYPGAATVARIGKVVDAPGRWLSAIFSKSKSSKSRERDPLLRHQADVENGPDYFSRRPFSCASSSRSSSSLENSPLGPKTAERSHGDNSHYHTFPRTMTHSRTYSRSQPTTTATPPVILHRDVLLARLTYAALTLSLAFFLFAAILEATRHKRKLIVESDVGILVAMVASLVFVLTGLVATFRLRRGKDVRWVERGVVAILGVLVCVGDMGVAVML